MKALASSIFLLFSFYLSAQETGHECYTELPTDSEELNELVAVYDGGCEKLPNLGRTLCLHIHYTIDSLGVQAASSAFINQELTFLNEFFAPIGVSFSICNEEVIQNFQLSKWELAYDEELTNNYYINPFVINVFIVNSISEPGPSYAGRTYYPGGPDVVLLDFDLMGDGKIWAHQMGHFFGLLHTDEIAFGDELVDQSNCDQAGDLICDTEAYAFVPVDSADTLIYSDNCEDRFSNVLDANNEQYLFPSDNLMSPSPVGCRCKFTRMQYLRMADQLTNKRNYLW